MALSLSTTDQLIEKLEELPEHELDAAIVMGPGVEGAVGQVRFRHHRAAQLIASGLKTVEVAELIGDTPQNIYTLLKSPAFRALVEQYIAQNWSEIEAVTKRARIAAAAGVRELHKRIETAPDTISTKDLSNATLGLLDRGGIVQKHVVFTGGLSRDDIREILESSNDSRRVVDVSAEGDREASMGRAGGQRAVLELLEGGDAGAEGGGSLREASPPGTL